MALPSLRANESGEYRRAGLMTATGSGLSHGSADIFRWSALGVLGVVLEAILSRGQLRSSQPSNRNTESPSSDNSIR